MAQKAKPVWDLAVSDRVARRWPSRVFLTPIEQEVFETWGVPARYVRKGWRSKLGDRCGVKSCGRPAKQAAHRIRYQDGILIYHLTPSYLMRWETLTATCRSHNDDVRWRKTQIEKHMTGLKR